MARQRHSGPDLIGEITIEGSSGEEGQAIVSQGSGEVPKFGDVLISIPPSGKCKVVNLYVNPDTGHLVYQYDDVPVE